MFDTKQQGLSRAQTVPAVRPWAWTLVCAVAACAASLCPAAAMAEAVIVVNAANTVALDDEAAAKIFLRQVKTFPDGAAASPINQKDGPATEEFRTKVLRKNAAQFKAYWAQQLFTGGGKAPNEVDGDEAVLKYVADTPGGIGYVEAGKSRSGVRVIKK
jgi:ABC-type phosphate transport system substrate-binding protein